MKKILMAACALGLFTALSGCADGGYGYGNGYGSYGGYGNSYGSYGGYGRGYNRGYSGYYNSYNSYRRNGYSDHADTHDALDDAHEQYHRQRGY